MRWRWRCSVSVASAEVFKVDGIDNCGNLWAATCVHSRMSMAAEYSLLYPALHWNPVCRHAVAMGSVKVVFTAVSGAFCPGSRLPVRGGRRAVSGVVHQHGAGVE